MANLSTEEEKKPDISLLTENVYKNNIMKAKLKSSLAWLLSIVYGKNVPIELQDPFYENTESILLLVKLSRSNLILCLAKFSLLSKKTKSTGKAMEIRSENIFKRKCADKNVEGGKKVDLLNLSVIDLSKQLNEERTQHQVTKQKLSDIKSEIHTFRKICLETACPVCKVTYNSKVKSPLMLPNGVSVCWKCGKEHPEKELLRFTKDLMIFDRTTGLFFNTAFFKLIERLDQNFNKFP